MPHCPFWHVAAPFAGALQAAPHMPQSETLLFRSTHASPHFVKPGLQVNPHWPLVHVGVALEGAAQTVPQPPQFEVSPETTTQLPLQFVVPIGHDIVQEPPAQTSFVPQAFPHVPQLFLSLCVLTHALPHAA